MDRPAIGRRTRNVLLTAVVVLSAVGLSAGGVLVPPEGEPNDAREGATTIEPGKTITGSISDEGDVDWFKFEAERGETVNATVVFSPGYGVEFRFVAPNGNGKVKVGGSDETETDGFTVRESGTYYVRAKKDASGPGPTDYSFTLRTSRTTDREPNERRANATRLSLNASVEDTLSWGDVDWYAAEVQKGASLEVSGTVAQGDGGIDFRLLDRNGTKVADDGNVAGGSEYGFNTTASYSGTYYIVARQSSGPNPDYTMDVRTDGTGSGSGGGLPGFGVPATVIAVLLSVLVARRLRDRV